MTSPIGLAEAVENLRRELKEATERSKGDELRLLVDAIELELELEISREGGPEGKVSFTLFGTGVEFGGGAKAGTTSAHRIKLSLRPKPPEGSAAYEMADSVSGRRRKKD
jgi:hypothetical protein